MYAEQPVFSFYVIRSLSRCYQNTDPTILYIIEVDEDDGLLLAIILVSWCVNMVTSGAILSAVTLYLSGVRFDDQFVPAYNKDSIYYYKNASEKDAQYNAIETERITYLNKLTFFPKCCAPESSYESANRECSKSNSTAIYDEINLETDLIRSTLEDCIVIVDRFVEKRNLKRSGGINGYLFVENESFALGQFCLDNIVESDRFYVVRICQGKDFCLNGIDNDWCIRKCCPDGYGFTDYKCTRTENNGLRVELNKNYYEKTDGYALYHSGNLNCSIANWHEYQEVNFTIKSDGNLLKYEDDTQYGEDEYCVDIMYNTDTQRLSDMVILCEFDTALHHKWNFIRAAVIITCICFAITITLYIIYDKPQRLIIISFCTANFIFWMMYGMRIFYVEFDGFCTIFGYIYYFISIMRLTWLNVLSCEIWLTVGNPNANLGKSKRQLLKRKFYYLLYAILVPTIATVAFILGHQGVYPLPKSIQPYIDVSNCAIDFKGVESHGYIFLCIPVTILTVINLVLFAKTLLTFLRIRKTMRRITDETSQHVLHMAKTNKRRGIIIFKLGLIMAVASIYYLLAYLRKLTDHPTIIIIGDILMYINIFEGVYFLLIFVVKWKYIKELLYKIKILKKKHSDNGQDSTSTESVHEMPMHAFK